MGRKRIGKRRRQVNDGGKKGKGRGQQGRERVRRAREGGRRPIKKTR